MRRAFVDIQEGQVHYRTEGSGDLLLLLHQTPMSSNEYSLVIPILARKYCVIAMDTLGYGDSDRPPRYYGIEDYARSVVSFLDALNIKKVIVAGHHTGALISCELAAVYNDRVSKAILSGCPGWKQPEEGQMWIKKYPPVEIKADGSHLAKVWTMAMERFPKTALSIAHSYCVDFLKTGLGENAEAGHIASFTYDVLPKLPMIKCPTLLLWGDLDPLYQDAQKVAKLVKNRRVAVIKGGTIYSHRLKPQEWAQAVLDFLGAK